MPEHTAWVEVEREALAHNLRQVRGLVGPDVRVLAVVKADAYGHGAVEASRTFLAAGADFLGVTRVEEALELREAGITAPVLVFTAIPPEQAPIAVGQGLSQTVCTIEGARALSEAAVTAGRTARVHVKVDSGMGRLGIRPEELSEFHQALTALPNLAVEGIYTHFATALERSDVFLRRQLDAFLGAARPLRGAGPAGPILHAANSGGLLRLEESRLDMVRPGTILYGQYPAPHLPRPLELRDGWRLRARVTMVKPIRRGESVGYGRDLIAPRDMRIAVVPLGYSDGVMLAPARTARSLRELLRVAREFLGRGRAGVRIGDRHAPFAGRVSMQMCCVDVTEIPGVDAGDEVTVPARRTAVSARLPRVYR